MNAICPGCGRRGPAWRAVLSLPFRLLIRIYQLVISPHIGPACRFEPSCSRYTADALRLRGLVFGIWLGVRRILRCHPLGGHGHDPVPVPPGRCRACGRRLPPDRWPPHDPRLTSP